MYRLSTRLKMAVMIGMAMPFLLLPQRSEAAEEGKREQSIAHLYTITDSLGSMELQLEVLTIKGSIQYFADAENWLYFEQMAGGLSITADSGSEKVSYSILDAGDKVSRICVEETLGTEVVWETENGYLFYLYSSLPQERLLEIAKSVTQRPEGAAP